MSSKGAGIDPLQNTKCPEGWQEVPLASVADIRFSGVNKVSQPGEEPVRLCNYIDVYDNDYITADMEFMRATATRTEIERFGLEVGDVIITKDSETPDDIGVPAAVDSTAPDLVCGYHLALIRPNKDAVDPTFLAKQLGHHRLARYFGRQANGSTRYGLSTAAIANALLRLPKLANQKAAGAFLRLLDGAIAKTEAVIAKLKQVRAGLLHDLLTRGLDDNGQFRDPIAHPEQFKDSPLGRIPTRWSVEVVGDLFHMMLGKMLSPKARLGGDARPYLGNRHVLWDRCNCSGLEYMDFSPEERARCKLQPGDLLICEGGEVGRTAIWRGELSECYFQKAIHRLRPRDNRIIPDYMLAFMKRAAQCGLFNNLTSQTSISHLTQEKLALLRVALPERHEQEMMATTWAAAEAQQEANQSHLVKLGQIKSGLASDLLTGRVHLPEAIKAGGA